MSDRFAFVIPLRNPSVANNWDATVALCMDTLRSLANSDDPRCEVLLVCREFPRTDLPNNITILRHPFPDPEKNWKDQHIDKYLKIKMGLVELHRRNAAYYVMKFDADDLVSKELVPWILSDGNRHGYVVEKGYRLDYAACEVTKIKNCFHKFCGSSNILYARPGALPSSMDDKHPYDLITQGHNIVVDTFLKRGDPLKNVPFPAVISRVQTGENITSHYSPLESGSANETNWKFYAGKYLKYTLRAARTAFARRISKHLVAEFLIPQDRRLRVR